MTCETAVLPLCPFRRRVGNQEAHFSQGRGQGIWHLAAIEAGEGLGRKRP